MKKGLLWFIIGFPSFGVVEESFNERIILRLAVFSTVIYIETSLLFDLDVSGVVVSVIVTWPLFALAVSGVVITVSAA